MGLVDAVKSFYRRYFDFKTRSSRSEYWWVILYTYIVYIILMLPVMGSMSSVMQEAMNNPELASDPMALYGPMFSGAGIGLLLFMLINIIPSIALVVRRFHDHNKSGWLYLLTIVLMIIPIVNLIVMIGLLVFMCMRGTVGDNRFGPDPLGY